MTASKLTLEQALALPDEELRTRIGGAKWYKVPDPCTTDKFLSLTGDYGFGEICQLADGTETGIFQHDIAGVPDYARSHDALAPVIAGLNEADRRMFAEHLFALVRPGDALRSVYDFGMANISVWIDATPRQKCVALILAKQ